MKRFMNTRLPHPQLGFTLIETMVALLVISVGMIGVAALHGQALSSSGIAIRRSVAIGLASDISDRIRVNRGAGAAYQGAAADNNCDDPTGGGGVDCSPAQMAAHDLFVWQAQIAQNLPGGTGAVAVNLGTNPTTYTVTVSWAEPTQGVPVTFTLAFGLPIY
jgi:type IV pilus assembly protein PilV